MSNASAALNPKYRLRVKVPPDILAVAKKIGLIAVVFKQSSVTYNRSV